MTPKPKFFSSEEERQEWVAQNPAYENPVLEQKRQEAIAKLRDKWIRWGGSRNKWATQ